MHLDELECLESDARRTLKLKVEHAARGHDWVVDSHSLTSCKLLELVALAKLGWPIWKGYAEKTQYPADTEKTDG